MAPVWLPLQPACHPVTGNAQASARRCSNLMQQIMLHSSTDMPCTRQHQRTCFVLSSQGNASQSDHTSITRTKRTPHTWHKARMKYTQTQGLSDTTVKKMLTHSLSYVSGSICGYQLLRRWSHSLSYVSVRICSYQHKLQSSVTGASSRVRHMHGLGSYVELGSDRVAAAGASDEYASSQHKQGYVGQVVATSRL